MKAPVEHHPAGIAKVDREQVWGRYPAATGRSLPGHTYPMLCPGAGQRSYCHRPVFKRIRRKFAVFPADGR